MSPEKDAKLRAAYPHVFQKPLINDYPIQCGDGWYHLLDSMCRTINRIVGFLPEEERWRYAAVQVKEKFGGLRFCLEDDHPESPVAHWIWGAETASLLICDVCGSAGTLIEKEGPARTRCDEHRDVRGRP